jgi:hypothetical protein
MVRGTFQLEALDVVDVTDALGAPTRSHAHACAHALDDTGIDRM